MPHLDIPTYLTQYSWTLFILLIIISVLSFVVIPKVYSRPGDRVSAPSFPAPRPSAPRRASPQLFCRAKLPNWPLEGELPNYVGKSEIPNSVENRRSWPGI
uniref:ATP synthase F0 subunit 8 n=1 Tax=Tenerodus fallax TaxID=2069446 RepID=UPI001FAFDF93|nr:ATP synthase F0 subunit 8 [Tenerodus fallax]UKP88390.1 ATP synthase F0 subunit 8 [Tenerodus fallax]